MAHRVDFKAIKEAASFERVLAYYGIDHRGRGPQRKAVCPFHDDTKPSLNVNLTTKLFNCFPCGDGGDIVKFVAKKEYPSNPQGHLLEAAEKLAEICGITRDEGISRASRRPTEKPNGAAKENQADTSSGTQTASAEPATGESAASNPPLTFSLKVDATHPYLSERNLPAETIETFGLGYCVSEKSIMRQRILIPIHNERGELVAYAGRWPGTSGWPDGTNKYMLPPKFQKMRVLFNLNRVIAGTLEGQWPGHEQHVVMVEGFFGVFSVHPLAPCVALMGSVVSPEHIELLTRSNIRSVTLMLDGPSTNFTPDECRLWHERARQIIHDIAAYGLFVRATTLAAGEQPDTIDHARLIKLVSL